MQGLLNRMRPLNRTRPHDSRDGSQLPRPLRAVIDGVFAGTGRAVWIEGAPGSGKSELLNLVLAETGARGGRLADCTGTGPTPRFGLDPLLERLGLDPASDDLRRLLHPRSGLLATLRRFSFGAPLIIAVDDLDRLDPAGIEFWGRLAVETRVLPVLLLATVRPEPVRADLIEARDDLRSNPFRIATCRCGPAEDLGR